VPAGGLCYGVLALVLVPYDLCYSLSGEELLWLAAEGVGCCLTLLALEAEWAGGKDLVALQLSRNLRGLDDGSGYDGTVCELNLSGHFVLLEVEVASINHEYIILYLWSYGNPKWVSRPPGFRMPKYSI